MAKKAPARKTAAGARKRPGASRQRGQSARRATAAGKKRAAAKPSAGASKRKGTARKPIVTARKRVAAKKTAGTRKGAGPARTTGRKALAPKKQAARPPARSTAPAKPTRSSSTARRPRQGGTGDERTLAQTPETGRSVTGRTNPMPTKRSTGTAAGAGGTRLAPGLERARRHLREVEEQVQGPPSSLDMERNASAARSGRAELQQAQRDHTETSPVMTAGDVDADWEDAYAVGDEAPGGDNPTPDQDRVDDIGKALGVEYEDNEELKAADKITERDRHRWELDPASSEDYPDRD